MNHAQKALLARLREIVDATPKSGALNAAGAPLYVTRFSQAIEARAGDGPALVAYARAKVHEPETDGYNALIRADRPDLTVEAVVADADSPWAEEFDDEDRDAARARLDKLLGERRLEKEAIEAEAVQHDLKILSQVSENRVAKGKAPLTQEQLETMLAEMAAKRAQGAQ